jgi:hypothetical protein
MVRRGSVIILKNQGRFEVTLAKDAKRRQIYVLHFSSKEPGFDSDKSKAIKERN